MRPVDIESLLDRLTLEEQVGLLSGVDFWTTRAVDRLGIPAVKVTDGPNGARGGLFKDGPTTACFPAGIALAATWSPTLIHEVGEALAAEARLKGARVLLAPTVNLHRTVLNGRNFECYSEDPHLTAEIAVAYVRGVQSRGVAATIKHFVGNESEYQRMSISVEIPERALRELYLVPFERAVKEAGVRGVMAAYNRLDGTFACDHRRLLDEVLRREWGFEGLVMSDWFALHSTEPAVLAGLDLEMPGPTLHRGPALVRAVHEGRVPPQVVRRSAARVLALAEWTGAFADPVVPPERSDDLVAHRELIRRVGAQASVLLKNQPIDGGPLLPLAAPALRSVAVIGQAARVPQIMGGGSANVNAHYRVAPLDALAEQLGAGVQLRHAPGADLCRWTPVVASPMHLTYYNSLDFSGPVVATQAVGTTEVVWFDTIAPGVDRQAFSVRGSVQFTVQEDGEHVFSLISAGRSRVLLGDEVVVDGWTRWTRGETFLSFGSEEVRARRVLHAGEVLDLVIEFTSGTPDASDLPPVRALRFGCHRPLTEVDVDEAVAVAAGSDVAIVFAGLNAEWDNEGLDRPHMQLPHLQNALIARVAAANPRTVVVLQTGSPVELPWLDQVPAVLQAWYPGQECGNAIADVLLGKAEPGGRLPQTWPRRLADSPAMGSALHYPGLEGRVVYGEGLLIGYRHYDAHAITPLFPFGHGLSYAEFEVESMQLAQTTLQAGERTTAIVRVRNVSGRSGSAVVQLYVGDDAASVLRAPKELRGFAKLALAPGEVAEVTLPIGMRDLAFFDEARHAWVAEAGHFHVHVGFSAADLRAAEALNLATPWQGPV